MSSVAIYARTSTNLQSSGLESQLHALSSHCKAKGITDVRIYTDAGVSGAKASRPGLDQLLADARAGLISSVVTYSLSRLSRSTRHLLQTLELLKSLGVGFVSLSEAIDLSTPTGVMVVTVLGAVAQLEREITAERVKTGLANAKSKGKVLGAPKQHRNKQTLILHLASQQLSHREIARLAGVSQSTVSRSLRQFESKPAV